MARGLVFSQAGQAEPIPADRRAAQPMRARHTGSMAEVQELDTPTGPRTFFVLTSAALLIRHLSEHPVYGRHSNRRVSP